MAVEWKEIYREGGTDVAVADGGTGVSTLADGGIVIGNGTSAVEVVTPGATTEILVGGGAATKPVWTTATGTGAPVRAISPALVTPALGTPTLTTPVINVGSDADGDMYYRASSALARLAKGAAYYRMAMNAAGTAPTWIETGVRINSSRAMDAATTDPAGSATIAIGAGSNAVLVLSYLGGKFGIGFAGRQAQFNLVETSAGVWAASTALITFYEAAGKTQTFTITSWSESTINGTWTRTGATAAGNGYFYLLSW